MVRYCDSKADITPIWVEQGFSPCFFYTAVPCFLLFTTSFFGAIKAYNYLKYAAGVRPQRTFAFWKVRIQLGAIIILTVHPVVKLILESIKINDGTLFGYQLLCSLTTFSSWIAIYLITYSECRYNTSLLPHRGHSWSLLFLVAVALISESLIYISFPSKLWFFIERNESNNIELGLFCVKYVLLALIFLLTLHAPGIRNIRQLGDDDDNDDSDDDLLMISDDDPYDRRGPWHGFKKKLVLLWPFMWPKKSLPVQFCVIVCILLLVSGRIVNLFLPIYYKKIVESLTLKNNTTNGNNSATFQLSDLEFRWDYILTYVALWFLQGGGSVGFISGLRSFLWMWVQQYTVRTTEVKLFSHLHSLSLRWHLSRKTGEVLRIVDRGTTSVNNLLNYVIFNVLPTLADIMIAIIFFLTSFNNWFAIIVFVTLILYLTVTIVVTEWRTKFRKEMNKLDNDMNARAVDSLLNFETVKYYGAEEFEVDRYRDAFLEFQKAEWISNSSSNLLDILQNVVITSGMLAGSLLCAWYVSRSSGLTVGDYVLFTSYVLQLCSPLNNFGSYYRIIQRSIIDMDNMFDLLNEQQEVKDLDGAQHISVTDGQIEFNHVSFHYRPDKPILTDISFVVPPGKTCALVGPSGAGKSTVIRLLFRFYDVQSGNILIDGQDISKVKQKSLRSLIGVVPQDTVLFNNDIEYNIRYGKIESNLEEIQQAARVAEIHDRILSFPDGYQTVVGERGLKLSGGEKQRVAIARTVLKSPIFVLLDEATSALDTYTERQIQSSLSKVCEGRTTIIVAHRLSTIIHADQIIVLKDGSIVESGKHEELLQNEEGVYASMWNQQLMKHNEQDDVPSSQDHPTSLANNSH